MCSFVCHPVHGGGCNHHHSISTLVLLILAAKHLYRTHMLPVNYLKFMCETAKFSWAATSMHESHTHNTWSLTGQLYYNDFITGCSIQYSVVSLLTNFVFSSVLLLSVNHSLLAVSASFTRCSLSRTCLARQRDLRACNTSKKHEQNMRYKILENSQSFTCPYSTL